MPLFNDADHFLLIPDFNSPLIHLEKFVLLSWGGASRPHINHPDINRPLFNRPLFNRVGSTTY